MEVVNVLETINPVLVPILSLYVAFAVFCVLNIASSSRRASDFIAPR